jgi:rubrerythrin
MTTMVFFTNNYADRSTREGYQFEFFCQRCGNGHASSFQHSVTGFGGRLLRIGGDLLGGEVGRTASQVGWDAEWMRDGLRGSTRDRALAKAVDEMKPHFCQCHRCGQWVCADICWNGERGLCTRCAPKLDQEIAGLQARAQVNQLDTKIRQVDWTGGVEYRDEVTARCPSCQADSGGGKYCQQCGTPLAGAPEAAPKQCVHCGAKLLPTALYCGGCGTRTG